MLIFFIMDTLAWNTIVIIRTSVTFRERRISSSGEETLGFDVSSLSTRAFVIYLGYFSLLLSQLLSIKSLLSLFSYFTFCLCNAQVITYHSITHTDNELTHLPYSTDNSNSQKEIQTPMNYSLKIQQKSNK